MHNEWVPPKSTPTPPPPPPPPPPSERERLRARLADVEADVERATLAMARLWSKLSQLRKEV
jgi:hypothetical protein